MFFGGFHSAKVDINNLSSNGSYIYNYPRASSTWKAILAKIGVPAGSTIFCQAFTRKPKDGRVWVSGSSCEENATDFSLHTDNRTGIGRRHFSVDVDKTSSSTVPRIKCLAKSGLMIEKGGERMTLQQDGTYLILEPVLLRLAQGLAFWTWSPDRSD